MVEWYPVIRCRPPHRHISSFRLLPEDGCQKFETPREIPGAPTGVSARLLSPIAYNHAHVTVYHCTVLHFISYITVIGEDS